MTISRETESFILDQVCFLNIFLEETRKRNKSFADRVGPLYSKIVGLGTPYEEAISSLRKAKNELDMFLVVVRKELSKQIATAPSKKVFQEPTKADFR